MIGFKKDVEKMLENKGAKMEDMQNKMFYFNTDEKGVILDENEYVVTNKSLEKYTTALNEIMLSDGTTCIVKSKIGNVLTLMNQSGKSISTYNNIILPYLGENYFGVDTVKYYLTRFTNKQNKLKLDNTEQYLMTVNAKREGEELIEGRQMTETAGMEQWKDVFSYRMFATEEYLKIRETFDYQIQQVKNDLIRQEIFKKFIRYTDNQNSNWAVAVNGKNARAFPVYDFDLCCDADISYEIETKTNDDKTDLKSFIMQYKDLPWMKKYLQDVIEKFDIQKLFEVSYQRTNTRIPNMIKTYYFSYFSQRLSYLKQILKELENDKSLSNEDEKNVIEY